MHELIITAYNNVDKPQETLNYIIKDLVQK